MRQKMNKKKRIGIAGLLCLYTVLMACKEKAEVVEVVRAIKAITVSEQATEKVLKFSGLVAAVDSSDLSFQMAGQVAEVNVDIGDRVKKGQVLAVLDPDPYELEEDAIKAELLKAKDTAGGFL
jgi:multidrug efflux pump subunit AcrA (membrane-fusion protein)